MLVEDNDTHAHLVERSLAKSDFPNYVFRVENGARALEFLRREGEFSNQIKPDVVLLDLKLPKIDGLEVLSVIKNDENLKRIPVVVMTTSNTQSDRAKAYEHHANSYVVKPIDFDKFRSLLNAVCVYWGQWNESPEGV